MAQQSISPESAATGRSPWAMLPAEAAHITPLTAPLDVDVRVPGSKSYTNRALIMAGLARGPSVLRGILRSDDSYWCIETLRALGVEVQVPERDVDTDIVHIAGCDGVWPHAQANVFIGSAGTTARFLPGALAASPHGTFGVDGSAQMRKRPLAALLDALTTLGADLVATDGGLPLQVRARGLQGGEVAMSGRISSQFFSGVLLASPYARTPTTVRATEPIVQQAYVLMTIDTMAQFGVQVQHSADVTCMQVQPQRYQGGDVALEADASTAGYFFALAALHGGRVRVTNIDVQTRQPDIKLLQVLERMGCTVQQGPGWAQVQRDPADPLRGGITVNMREMSDQTLTLAALAAFAHAPITITHVAHVRHHESDRIAAACASLRALGLQAEEHDDGLTVHPGPMHGAALPTFDDHRVAMSMALVGTRVPGVQILQPGCVSKTCPTFFDALTRLGVGVQLIPA